MDEAHSAYSILFTESLGHRGKQEEIRLDSVKPNQPTKSLCPCFVQQY